MKYLTAFATLFLIVAHFGNSFAHEQQVCEYKNSKDEIISLRFLPYVNRGQSYVDVDSDGKCIKRVKCWEGSKLKIEECSDVDINCDNIGMYNYDYFPTCCIKC